MTGGGFEPTTPAFIEALVEDTMATPAVDNKPNANYGKPARQGLFDDTIGRQSDVPDKAYSAKDDPAVNPKGNLGASVPSTEASRLALLITEGCQLTPAMFAIMCEDPYPETLVTEGFDWMCGLEPVSKLHEMLLAERESVDRMAVQLVMRKRASGYYSELISPPVFEPLPSRAVEALQSASDVKPIVRLTPGDYEKANAEVRAKAAKEVKPHNKLAASEDRETDLDKAAEAKWHVKPAKIDELFEAIQFAIAHPHKPEAQELTDGFVIIKNAHVWKLEHPAIGRLPVIATRLDEKQPLRDVVRRQDVRDCLVALRESVEAKREQRSGPVLIKKAVEEFAANVTPVREKVTVAALDPHKFYHRATMHPAPIMLDKKGL
jgi:hypothetical protein